ncbi:MAG TPA: hypothetical protein VF541_10185, partial [Longimicrobium sp.]
MTATRRGERLGYLWWVRAPLRAARRWPLLGRALADGLYLLRWPAVASAAPPLALLLGLLAGALHPGAAFTRSFLLTALLVVCATAGAQLGIWLVAGFALGDLVLHGHPVHAAGLAGAVRTWVPLLLSYYLLALACVNVPLLGQAVAARARAPRLPPRAAGFLAAATFVAAAALLVYAWAVAVPMLIRPVFTWHGGVPDREDIAPLQNGAWALAALAGAAAAVRCVLEGRARDPRLLRVAEVVRIGLAMAVRPAAPGSTRGVARAAVGGAALTLLVAGLVSGWVGAGLTWAFFAALLHARDRAAHGAAPWTRLLARIPLLVRLAAGLGLGWLLSWPIMAALWSRTQSLYPVLLATCVSVTLVTLLTLEPARGAPEGDSPAPPPPRSVTAVALLAAILVPTPAWADNCSGLSDCFYTLALALAVAAALALLIALVMGTGGGAGGLLALAGGG